MFRNDPDKDWERFARDDPYYSMLNTEKYRTRRLTDALIEEVLQSGESSVAYFLDFAEQQFGPLEGGDALEFGCGVGRNLLPLARRFSSVTGVDIAPSMLREAGTNCARAGVRNVNLVLSDDHLSRVGGGFRFILSYLVLQHIPVRRGELIIRELLSRLAPGGVAALHVTTDRTSPRWRHAVHVVRRSFSPLHYLGNVLGGSRWNEPMMQTNLYDLERVRRFIHDAGLSEAVAIPVQHADHVGQVLFAWREASASARVRAVGSP